MVAIFRMSLIAVEELKKRIETYASAKSVGDYTLQQFATSHLLEFMSSLVINFRSEVKPVDTEALQEEEEEEEEED